MSAEAYEEIAYPGYAYAQTHPDRLATVGTLVGAGPAHPTACRLLEIGCGDGGNLLPMALGLPGSEFVGFDASASAIERARGRAAEMGAANVRFDHALIGDYAVEPGGFDFVVAHGVYSWVSADDRDALLALMTRALGSGGIGYVSYNALPGARVPQTLYELLRLHTRGVADPSARITRARRLLEQLAAADERVTPLAGEAARLLASTDALLYHDALAEFNEPIHFTDFVAHAGRHALQYLTEASFIDTQMGFLPPELLNELFAGRPDDVLFREQALDQLKVRRFRQTLVGPDAVELDRDGVFGRLADLWVASPAVAQDDPETPGRTLFAVTQGSTLTSDRPAVTELLRRATEVWPRAVPIREVLGPDPDPDLLAMVGSALLQSYGSGVVDLHVHPPTPATAAGDRPEATPLARVQAAAADPRVVNFRHATVRLADDPLACRLLELADGSRDRAALAAETQSSADDVDACLHRLARGALLVA